MSATATPKRPTYGNWIEQRSPGVLGAGLLGTVVLLGGMVLSLLALVIAGMQVALVMVTVVGIAFTAIGTPIGRTIGRRWAFWRGRSKGENQWRSGMFTFNKNPAMRLPGLAGRTQLLEHHDVYGNPFAVVKHPKAGGTYTIVARCIAEGPWMQDRERINAWVAGYGRVLASCGQEPALMGAKAITDTAPDPGGRLGAMVSSLRVEGSPDLARQVMEECVADYPAASSENTTYVELTFKGRSLNRKGEEDQILSELARRVPGVLGQLQDAGGGSVDMVTATELPRIVRAGYDPESQVHMEAAELAGEDQDMVPWNEAGPVASQDLWDRFVHDSGTSVTWEMFGAPRTAITEVAIGALLMPHHDFGRKRVALVYRPHPSDESLTISERDLNTATFVSKQSKKRMTAAAKRTVEAAERTTEQVAAGAVMVSLSLLVTVTTADSEDMLQATSTLTSKAGAVPVRLRRCYGSQASAFAATLPIGFLPWEHTVIPDKVREWM